MCLLFETIKIKNGIIFHTELHQARMERSMATLFKSESKINLREVLSNHKTPTDNWVKCKLIYDTQVREISFQPYIPRKIKSLKIVENNEINYSLKYNDRETINKLFNLRESNDDIIIVKNGFITDSSYSNLIFWDGHNWFTPSTPLLKGVQRQYLLSQCKIIERDIKVSDLKKFKKVGLINAMMDFNDMPIIETKFIEM